MFNDYKRISLISIAFLFLLLISMGTIFASENISNVENNELSGEVLSSLDNEILIDNWYNEDIDYGITEFDLKPTKLTTTYNSGKYFTVKVVDKYTNDLMDNIQIKLKVFTGKKYKNYYVTTGSNGIAKFKASTLSIGTHLVHISVDDYDVTSKPVESVIKINKAKTIVKAPPITKKYNKAWKFKITVKDKSTKKAIKELKLKLKVYTGSKYKLYSVKTDYYGVACLKTKSLSSGKHKIVIYSKDKKFIVNAKSYIKIKKTKTSSKKTYGGYYVASHNSDKFHYSTCSYAKKIKSYNKITFNSRQKAISESYTPCSICHP